MSVTPITIETTVSAPLETVWKGWTRPEHITGWAFASDEWEAPEAENELRVGGMFRTRMQDKNTKEGFDFSGTYTEVKEFELLEYVMEDGRKVTVRFEETPSGVKVIQTFDPEMDNSLEKQREGWLAILDNFKIYAERMT
jgi:uncharacterized protein YndB with AHSA1/START domain